MSKRTRELMRANSAWEKEHLSKENQRVMTDIFVYIRSSAISEYEQELVRRDIMEMLAQGQQEGRSAEDVIGSDMQTFCDEVVAAMPPRTAGERVLDTLRTGLLAFVVLALCWTAFSVIDTFAEQSWPYFSLTVGDVISQALIFVTAFIVFRGISRHTFDDQLGRLFVLIFCVLAVSILASIYLTQFLCNIHILVVAAVLVVCFILYKCIDVRVD